MKKAKVKTAKELNSSGTSIGNISNYPSYCNIVWKRPYTVRSLSLKQPYKAAYTNKPAKVNEIMQKGQIDMNAPDKHGRSALHYAAYKGYKDVVGLMLLSCNKVKIDADVKDNDGRTALFKAVEANQQRCAKELLLKSDVNTTDSSGVGILHYCAFVDNSEMMDTIFKYMPDLELRDRDGRTPLHIASIYGNELSCQRLLAAGANIDSFDHYNRTPLFSACDKGNDHIVKFLLDRGSDPSIQDKSDCTALDYAKSSAYKRINTLFIDAKNIADQVSMRKIDAAKEKDKKEKEAMEANEALKSQSPFEDPTQDQGMTIGEFEAMARAEMMGSSKIVVAQQKDGQSFDFTVNWETRRQKSNVVEQDLVLDSCSSSSNESIAKPATVKGNNVQNVNKTRAECPGLPCERTQASRTSITSLGSRTSTSSSLKGSVTTTGIGGMVSCTAKSSKASTLPCAEDNVPIRIGGGKVQVLALTQEGSCKTCSHLMNENRTVKESLAMTRQEVEDLIVKMESLEEDNKQLLCKVVNGEKESARLGRLEVDHSQLKAKYQDLKKVENRLTEENRTLFNTRENLCEQVRQQESEIKKLLGSTTSLPVKEQSCYQTGLDCSTQTVFSESQYQDKRCTVDCEVKTKSLEAIIEDLKLELQSAKEVIREKEETLIPQKVLQPKEDALTVLDSLDANKEQCIEDLRKIIKDQASVIANHVQSIADWTVKANNLDSNLALEKDAKESALKDLECFQNQLNMSDKDKTCAELRSIIEKLRREIEQVKGSHSKKINEKDKTIVSLEQQLKGQKKESKKSKKKNCTPEETMEACCRQLLQKKMELEKEVQMLQEQQNETKLKIENLVIDNEKSIQSLQEEYERISLTLSQRTQECDKLTSDLQKLRTENEALADANKSASRKLMQASTKDELVNNSDGKVNDCIKVSSANEANGVSLEEEEGLTSDKKLSCASELDNDLKIKQMEDQISSMEAKNRRLLAVNRKLKERLVRLRGSDSGSSKDQQQGDASGRVIESKPLCEEIDRVRENETEFQCQVKNLEEKLHENQQKTEAYEKRIKNLEQEKEKAELEHQKQISALIDQNKQQNCVRKETTEQGVNTNIDDKKESSNLWKENECLRHEIDCLRSSKDQCGEGKCVKMHIFEQLVDEWVDAKNEIKEKYEVIVSELKIKITHLVDANSELKQKVDYFKMKGLEMNIEEYDKDLSEILAENDSLLQEISRLESVEAELQDRTQCLEEKYINSTKRRYNSEQKERTNDRNVLVSLRKEVSELKTKNKRLLRENTDFRGKITYLQRVQIACKDEDESSLEVILAENQSLRTTIDNLEIEKEYLKKQKIVQDEKSKQMKETMLKYKKQVQDLKSEQSTNSKLIEPNQVLSENANSDLQKNTDSTSDEIKKLKMELVKVRTENDKYLLECREKDKTIHESNLRVKDLTEVKDQVIQSRNDYRSKLLNLRTKYNEVDSLNEQLISELQELKRHSRNIDCDIEQDQPSSDERNLKTQEGGDQVDHVSAKALGSKTHIKCALDDMIKDHDIRLRQIEKRQQAISEKESVQMDTEVLRRKTAKLNQLRTELTKEISKLRREKELMIKDMTVVANKATQTELRNDSKDHVQRSKSELESLKQENTALLRRLRSKEKLCLDYKEMIDELNLENTKLKRRVELIGLESKKATAEAVDTMEKKSAEHRDETRIYIEKCEELKRKIRDKDKELNDMTSKERSALQRLSGQRHHIVQLHDKVSTQCDVECQLRRTIADLEYELAGFRQQGVKGNSADDERVKSLKDEINRVKRERASFQQRMSSVLEKNKELNHMLGVKSEEIITLNSKVEKYVEMNNQRHAEIFQLEENSRFLEGRNNMLERRLNELEDIHGPGSLAGVRRHLRGQYTRYCSNCSRNLDHHNHAIALPDDNGEMPNDAADDFGYISMGRSSGGTPNNGVNNAD